METNLTINVGYFSGPASLNTGEIVGISITMVLVVMIIVVIIAVLVLKVRPAGLAREKQTGSSSHEMSFTTVEAAHNNGSVVINGTTYSASNSGSGGGGSGGLASGYINPDVIPALHSPQVAPSEDHSVEMAQNRLNTTTAGSSQQRYENLPLPVTSVGVEADINNYAYSPNILVRNSSENNRSVVWGVRGLEPGPTEGYVAGCMAGRLSEKTITASLSLSLSLTTHWEWELSMIVSVMRAGEVWWDRGECWGPRHQCSTET